MNMSFEQTVEQYTTYLLKLSYLNIRNRQTAEDIVQDVFIKLYEKFGDHIPLDNTKSYLVMMTMNRCRDYFKSWHYRKIQLMKTFSKGDRETSHEMQVEKGQSELVQAISKLPINFREVIILYYFDEQTTTEMAKILNCPIGTVKMRLQRARELLQNVLKDAEARLHANNALGNWDTETARVKQAIYRVTKEKQAFKAKYKHLNWKSLTMIAGLLALTLGGGIVWQRGDEANAPIPSDDAAAPTLAPVVEVVQSDIFPHEKTLQLYRYEAFYYNYSFYSQTATDVQVLNKILSTFFIFYHMDKFNYSFPKDREEHYRNRAAAMFTSSMKDANFKKFFEFIQRKHGITEEDYIEHYYFIEEKRNFMYNLLQSKQVGFVDGEFHEREAKKEYEAILGISLDELNEKLMSEVNDALNHKEEVKNPPLQRYMYGVKFLTNDEGKVFIAPSEFNPEYSGGYYSEIGWAIEGIMSVVYGNIFTYESGLYEQLPMLNRMNFPEVVTLLEQFEGTAEQESLAQEVIEFIRILENSIDMELKRDFNLPQI